MAPYNLAVGVGLHTGEVIEGLLGSDTTRKYENHRRCRQYRQMVRVCGGEMRNHAFGGYLLSPITISQPVTPRTLQVKGKADQLQAFAIHP